LAKEGNAWFGIDYFEVIPIVFSHVSTNWGHPVIGNFLRRSPNACPP
jgi:hypothetical protein